VRRFPHHPVVLRHEYDNKQPHIAGADKGSIYLLARFVPLVITVIDTRIRDKKKQLFRINYQLIYFPFRSVRVTVVNRLISSVGRYGSGSILEETYQIEGVMDGWQMRISH
jgi:hypothetical protein